MKGTSTGIFKKKDTILASYKEKEYKQNQLLQSLAAAVYTCDPKGYIKFYNKAAVDLWGREPEIGKDLWCGSWKIFEPDGVTPVPLDNCPMAIALKECRPVRGIDIIVERPDGIRRNIMPYPDIIVDASGTLVEAVNMLIDITDLKQKENKLQLSEDKYKNLSEELQKSLNMEEEFISIASHELKTPITSINAFLQILLEMYPELKDERTHYMLTRSKTQLNRLIELISELLDVTKIKAGKLDLNLEEVCLNTILEDVIYEHTSTMTSRKIFKTGNSTGKIKADRIRIEQVISNILSNAEKYSDSEKDIIVSIVDNKKNIQVDVQDFGKGIAKENITKVFDRFFRAHGQDGGMLSSLGLGLYISADIVKRHNGKIWVDSEIGKGSTFHFSIPSIP